MRGLGFRQGMIAAIKIDTLSLIAYEVGMFAWMGFRSWLFLDMQPVTWSYWLMMQIAMVLGFATTYPVNWWLISRGIEKRRCEGPAGERKTMPSISTLSESLCNPLTSVTPARALRKMDFSFSAIGAHAIFKILSNGADAPR